MLLIYAFFEECHHVVELLLNPTNLKMEEKDLYKAKQFIILHLHYMITIRDAFIQIRTFVRRNKQQYITDPNSVQ